MRRELKLQMRMSGKDEVWLEALFALIIMCSYESGDNAD
jgi:hypothetical protein